MQSQQSTVLAKKTIDTTKIVYDDIILTQNDQFAVAKIWYQPSSDNMHSLLYQTMVLPVYSYDNSNGKFLLRLNGENEQQFLSEIDQLSINYIKKSGLLQKLSLSPKEVRYRTIVTDNNKEGERMNLFELKNTLKTKYYSNGIKKSKNLDDVECVLKKGINVKVIVEFDGLVVDIKRGTIFTNIILHQFRIEKIVPKKIELVEYSFLDSDNESDDEDIENDEILTQVNNEDEDDDIKDDIKEDEDIVQQIATHDIIRVDEEEEEISSDCNESEENSYDEESSVDVDVEDFVSKLKQTQPKPVQVQKMPTPPKPKRGRPSSKK